MRLLVVEDDDGIAQPMVAACQLRDTLTAESWRAYRGPAVRRRPRVTSSWFQKEAPRQ